MTRPNGLTDAAWIAKLEQMVGALIEQRNHHADTAAQLRERLRTIERGVSKVAQIVNNPYQVQ